MVLTERMVRKLPDFPALTLPETFYILKLALEGYQLLYKKLGEFVIRAEMMGLNSEGEFKVWCGTTPGRNTPDEVVDVKQEPIVSRISLAPPTK
jgi:hypothetical protein